MRTTPDKQRGIALFISLVLLLVLTIAGISAVQTTSLEERMARNTHDSLLAFQAAESALREAETFLLTNVNNTAIFTSVGNAGLWTAAGYGQDERWEDPTVWVSGSPTSVEVTNAMSYVNDQPRFIIEHVATVVSTQNPYQLGSTYLQGNDNIEVFRVTARGVGGTANAQVVLQSTFGMIF